MCLSTPPRRLPGDQISGKRSDISEQRLKNYFSVQDDVFHESQLRFDFQSLLCHQCDFFNHSCSDGVNNKRQSPALVCDRAAAGSDPVHTGLPPIRGRSENTFHVLRLPQHRTPGPTPRTRALLTSSISAEVSNCPSIEETSLLPPFFPVARSMSSLSDAIPCLQSTCCTRGLICESGRDAATKFTFFNSVRSRLTVPVPKLAFKRIDQYFPFRLLSCHVATKE